MFARNFSSDDKEALSMAQPAALLILPTSRHADEETDACQTTASLLTQRLEDLRLAERVERALHATGYNVLREIKVFVNARIVFLAGRVPSYHMKQVAQATALAVPGTHQIRNDLDVVQPS
jgi:osmotically-inducible protein OsmY